jgi:hypothetical protein
MRRSDSSVTDKQFGAELPRECRYRLKKRTRGSDLAGNYSFDSQVTPRRERGTLFGVTCESAERQKNSPEVEPKIFDLLFI